LKEGHLSEVGELKAHIAVELQQLGPIVEAITSVQQGNAGSNSPSRRNATRPETIQRHLAFSAQPVDPSIACFMSMVPSPAQAI
jgi:hypothetical protein